MTLTDTQLILLSAAAQRSDGLLSRPDRLGGRALELTISKLGKAGLVEAVSVGPNDPAWSADADGFPLGLKVTPRALAELGILDPGEDNAKTKPVSPQPRAGTKRADVMALLSRTDGASITQITAATGWLPHTARAMLSGLRKAGFAIEKKHRPERGTTYRIAGAASDAGPRAEV